MSVSAADNDAPEQESPPDVKEQDTVVEIPPDEPPAEPKPSRAERRAARGADYAEEARQARAEREQERAERQRLAVELAELRGRVSAGEQGKPDPTEVALEAVAKRIEGAVSRMGSGDAAAVNEWHQLRREETRLLAKQEAEAAGKSVEERVTQRMPQQMDPRQAALYAEFPSLQDDADFRQVANGKVATLVRLEKRNMENPAIRFATLREGAALAARELGIGGDERRAPTARDRERVSGTGSGDSGAGQGKTTVHLTEAQTKLARAHANSLGKGELTQEQANVMWWKNVGHKIANK